MKDIQTKKAKGFTIIEVVLVLAIAGLIFLMVFIALPALQRNQRDTQRKNDLSRVQSAINSFQANNRGRVPTAAEIVATGATGFTDKYMKAGGDSFTDPSGTAYSFTAETALTTNPHATNFHAISYYTNAKCNGEARVAGGGNNKVAVAISLEGGGIYCLNN